MKWKLSCISLFLLTIFMLGSPAFAGPRDRQKPEDALDKMMREGWKPVAPGVLQRRTGALRVETYAIGADGLRWAVQEMENRLRFLESQYQARPKGDLRRTIKTYRQEIVKLRKDLEQAEAIGDDEMPADAFEKSGCSSVSFAATATATNLTNTQGVTATGTAHFNNTCGWYVETHAEAYATATINGVVNSFSQIDGPKGTLNTTLSSSATATIEGGPDCSSSAYSWARYSAGNIFYSAHDANSLCPGITGPSTVSFSSNACISVTWSLSNPGGIPPYSYSWSVNGEQVGTDISYTRQVCPSDTNFDLAGTVTDSTQTIAPDGTSTLQSATQTLAVSVISPLELGPITGPTSVLFASSAAVCESKTWSASASGGSAPYSYAWAVGGVQVGTGTSYTRQVCPSDANFTLTATATDSSSPTSQSAARTLAFAVSVAPLTLAPITGPSSVPFTSATCVSKTWSTSASGGAPPYSYKWSIGGVQVGTGTSYTRQVCPSDPSATLTATVTDSTTPTPQTGTQSLVVTVIPPLTLAAITGPTSSSFSSSTAACVSKTWSTSASGGTLPYAYKWSIGGVQVGTGTSYTRQVCPSDASFTLTATVTDNSTPTPQSTTRTLAFTVSVGPLALAAITGPMNISFVSSTAACVTATWSTSASGGTPTYSYKWSVNGTQVGTGTSYTRQVCPSHASFTLAVTVTDSSTSQQSTYTRSQTITVSVTQLALAAITGPTSISFTSSTAACVNKTWSTSASGGTTPYSYKWSVGGTQVGTGTSYTRQVCPSHANFTLTATVTDSTTPTAQSATRTQAVTITVPLSVSITGPTQAYFEAATCETYTWTASVSGGAPTYSYKWMVGTTQVGTGSSYSRSVCYNHADFTLSLTVTDSGGQSGNASKAVDVYYSPTTCGGTGTTPLTHCN